MAMQGEKIAVALGASVKSLFEPIDDEAIEGFVKIKGKIYQFNNRNELLYLIPEKYCYLCRQQT